MGEAVQGLPAGRGCLPGTDEVYDEGLGAPGQDGHHVVHELAFVPVVEGFGFQAAGGKVWA